MATDLGFQRVCFQTACHSLMCDVVRSRTTLIFLLFLMIAISSFDYDAFSFVRCALIFLLFLMIVVSFLDHFAFFYSSL